MNKEDVINICVLSHVQFFATPWTSPLSMGFSGQKYWSGLPCEYTHTHTHTHTQWNTAAAAAKSLQSCLTLCDPIDGSPPGSPVPGILQARTLEWVAISFSNV